MSGSGDKRDQDAKRKAAAGSPASRPGVVSVDAAAPAEKGAGRPSAAVKPPPTTGANRDSKAILREEMNAIRASQGPATPGVVAVSMAGVRTSATDRAADEKAHLRQEVNKLRSQGPGAMTVSSPAPAPGPGAGADGKAAIKREMESLKGAGLDNQTPGVVAVSADSDAFQSARAERASRKVRSSQMGPAPVSPKREAASASVSSKGYNTGTSIPGVSRETGPTPQSSLKASGAPPPESLRESQAAMVQEKERMLLNDARSSQNKDDTALLKEKSKENIAVGTVVGATVEMHPSSKSFENGKSSKELPGDPEAGVYAHVDEDQMVSAQVIDEDELEKEYQARMLENTVTADVVTEEELAKQQKGGVCWKWCCCFSVIVAIVVGITVPLTKKDPTLPPTMAPTPQPVEDYVFDIVYPISGDNVLNETTPQYQAYQWLLYDDPADYDLKELNQTFVRERYIAALMYFVSGGDYWTENLDFLSSKSHCEWNLASVYGIFCDPKTYEVLDVNLALNNLTGSMPDELGYLDTLRNLKWSETHESHGGTIPSTLGRPKNIQMLFCRLANLVGTIPPELSGLTAMTNLDMYQNLLTGEIPGALWSKWNSIINIDLDDNMLEGTIPTFSFQSPLRYLYIERNNLGGTIPVSLFQNPELQLLYMGGNYLTGTIPQQIGFLSDLVEFGAAKNKLSGRIPVEVGKMESLERLYLTGNELSGTIPSQLEELRKLIVLGLDSNQLTGTLPPSLAEADKIEQLYVNDNLLVGSVPPTYGELRLSDFFLNGNGITDGLQSLFCSNRTLYTSIHADCGGEPAEIECDCCTSCCEGDVCDVDFEEICMVNGANVELLGASEDRGTVCTCPEGLNRQSCSDTCEICTIDGEICAVNSEYGYIFNNVTGEIDNFRSVIQYTKGVDATLVFTKVPNTFACELEVNGEKCRHCTPFECGSGFSAGFLIDCGNLENGYGIESCEYEEGEQRGILEVFRLIDPTFRNGCEPQFDNV